MAKFIAAAGNRSHIRFFLRGVSLRLTRGVRSGESAGGGFTVIQPPISASNDRNNRPGSQPA
jgi:hypothetical protein